MKKISFMTLLCASLMCMGLFACGEDDEIVEQPEPTPENPEPTPEPEQARYVDIDYTLNCSEDLLDYAIPQVTFVDDSGQQTTIQITDSEWEASEDATFSVTFENSTVMNARMLKWTKRVHRETFPVDDQITVSYLPKADMPDYDETRVNKFFHDVSVNMHFVDEANNSKISAGNTGNVNISCDVKNSIDEILFWYIDALEIPFVYEVNKSNIIIGADQEEMEERIREYQDTQGIRVESNGEYTINDDESQRSEKEPEVDITYTLNCSEDFLQYATPQVSYTDNNGSTVTYLINESEFEINKRVNKWAGHLHGDEYLADAEEDATILKWSKHVHYDNFQAVDDKMTVTYVPKEGYDGGLRVSHIFQNLSAGFRVVDEKGNSLIVWSKNTIDSNMIEGESKLTWKFMDEDGNLNIFDISAFIPIAHWGTNFETLNASIINSYKGFQGFHIEKDGTYTTLTE